MRWSCPHCGVRSALADDKVGSDWEFSKCFSCGGYAMIRRPEVDLIKIDRAPTGQKILLPEESETTLLGAHAAQRLESLKISAAQKPFLEPAHEQVDRPNSQWRFQVPQWNAKNLIVTGLIASSLFAFGSGVYFFLAGQELLHKSAALAAAPQAQVADSLESRAMAPLRAAEDGPSLTQSGLGATGFMVRPRTKGMLMRTGPGLNFPVAGAADIESFYYVTDWSDRWFKVSVNSASKAGISEAWIHNKEVELIGRSQESVRSQN
ncbi:MAG: hypothetical protein AABZ55_07065 [Bdellovibrionota bacterium]